MNPWEKVLLSVTTGLTIAVLVKLWSSGLVRIYRLLFYFLVSDILSELAALTIPYDTTWYGYSYFFLQTLKIAVAIPVLVEIYALALEKTPALAQFGRNTVIYVFGAAASVSVRRSPPGPFEVPPSIPARILLV